MAASEETQVELINLKVFLTNWVDNLEAYDFVADTDMHSNVKTNNFVKEKLGISKEMAEELDSVCRISALTCEGEVPLNLCNPQTTTIPEDVDLVTLGLLKEDVKKRAANRIYKDRHSRQAKYSNYVKLHEVKQETLSEVRYSIPLPEVMLNVRIYSPFHRIKERVNQPLVLWQEYQVLGHQKLTELRDKLICAADRVVPGDFSDHPNLIKDITAKDLYKSGLFYIENTYYNDMRDKNNRDYSSVIIDWLRTKSPGTVYTSARMEETSFIDLSVRLGHPYLYLHQGNCEHIVVFSEIRLVHPTDKQDVREYPMLIRDVPKKRQSCKICYNHQAEWMTQGSPLVPEDPFFLCGTCFQSLHYDKAGNKLFEFEAYPM